MRRGDDGDFAPAFETRQAWPQAEASTPITRKRADDPPRHLGERPPQSGQKFLLASKLLGRKPSGDSG